MKIHKDNVAIEMGMCSIPGMKPGNISSGNDYSYIHIRGVSETLPVTHEVVREYVESFGFSHVRNPLSNERYLLRLMNIALRHLQYIDYEEVLVPDGDGRVRTLRSSEEGEI